MAYITCKKCGCQMSDKSEACPVCGTPVVEEAAPQMPPPVPPISEAQPQPVIEPQPRHSEQAQVTSYPTNEQVAQTPLQRYKKWIIIGGAAAALFILLIVILLAVRKKNSVVGNAEAIATSESVQQKESPKENALPADLEYHNFKTIRYYRYDEENITRVSYDIDFPKTIPSGRTSSLADILVWDVSSPYGVGERITRAVEETFKYRTQRPDEDAISYIEEVISQGFFYTDILIPCLAKYQKFGEPLTQVPNEGDGYVQEAKVNLKGDLYIPTKILQMELTREYINEDFPNGITRKYYIYDIQNDKKTDAISLAVKDEWLQVLYQKVAIKIFQKYTSGEVKSISCLCSPDKVRLGRDRLYLDMTDEIAFSDEYESLIEENVHTIVEMPYVDYKDFWTDRLKELFNLQYLY